MTTTYESSKTCLLFVVVKMKSPCRFFPFMCCDTNWFCVLLAALFSVRFSFGSNANLYAVRVSLNSLDQKEHAYVVCVIYFQAGDIGHMMEIFNQHLRSDQGPHANSVTPSLVTYNLVSSILLVLSIWKSTSRNLKAPISRVRGALDFVYIPHICRKRALPTCFAKLSWLCQMHRLSYQVWGYW